MAMQLIVIYIIYTANYAHSLILIRLLIRTVLTFFIEMSPLYIYLSVFFNLVLCLVLASSE